MEVGSTPNPLAAEIVAIGDELTSGQRLDTNSQWLAEQLTLLGVQPRFHTTVADQLEAKLQVFQTAIERADMVLVTGGLGPTADDLTRQVIADLAGVELQLDQESLDHIRRIFESRGRRMPENNTIQAMFPAGSRIIRNPFGTAPGIDLEIEREQRRTRLFALPGVPAEMKQMWKLEVLPAIESMMPGTLFIRHHAVHCFGRGESDIEEMLPDLVRRGREPQVGITASQATISLRIVATDHSEHQCMVKIEQTESLIRQELGNLVFGSGEQQLQDVVVDQLTASGHRLAMIDCATDGLIARLIGTTGNRARVFAGGLSFADTGQLSAFFDLPPDRQETGDSLANWLDALVTKARKRFDCDGIVVALGPRQVAGMEVECCRLRISLADQVFCDEVPLIGHPSIREPRFAKFVLNQLRLMNLSETR